MVRSYVIKNITLDKVGGTPGPLQIGRGRAELRTGRELKLQKNPDFGLKRKHFGVEEERFYEQD